MSASGHDIMVNENGSITLRVPFSIQRKGGKRYIIMPAGAVPYEPPKQSEPLVNALLKAFHWKELLDTGAFDTLTEIAAKEKLNKSYVMRVFKMTLLAPDIIAAILDGKQPQYLTLMDFHFIPADWSEQRQRFGFSTAKII